MKQQTKMRMLDLCCGLKGASQAMFDRGWEVITLDIEERFNPDIVVDVRSWKWGGGDLDLIWASPPCVEFSRESMPWCKTGKEPDMSIYHACRRIIGQAKSRYWIIENVRGAVAYFGTPKSIYGPFYLWGFFPIPGKFKLKYRHKESYPSGRRAERAMIPYTLSENIAKAIEQSYSIFDMIEVEHETEN